MSDLLRAISFSDDIDVVFEALSEWCRLTKTNPNSVEGCSIASRLFDLFQAGCESREGLLAAIARGEPAKPFRVTASAGPSAPTANAS
ncbi:hypothetical protein ASC97_25110 [Rhizobium sp. Root1203]|jgi:hypothetical protein|uniref:hypothetical protein n=1 Tax=Rhizobium sp. Root1203 TaxID=1736427 RepID=UPI00070CF286|nr:hypothetical protein [Rhizobium sp. Root1203]KQV26942.1 hypothetical protein ASC97_25110 [Rhizobium sp. Root1203]